MKLDQSVFDGAPDWAEWAVIDGNGSAWWAEQAPLIPRSTKATHVVLVGKNGIIGTGFKTENWKQSPIKRDRCGSCPNKTDGVCCGGAK